MNENLLKMNGEEWDEALEESKLNGIQSMLKSFETLLGMK